MGMKVELGSTRSIRNGPWVAGPRVENEDFHLAAPRVELLPASCGTSEMGLPDGCLLAWLLIGNQLNGSLSGQVSLPIKARGLVS